MKQVFKNVELSRTKVVNNILKVYDLCSDSDKYDWYQEANNFASILHQNINIACGVIASLSPMVTWDINKRLAKMAFICDPERMKCIKIGAYKAKAIIDSDGNEQTILKILNGNKIKSFYLNIRYPDKAIALTIDRHALSIALNQKYTDELYRSMTAKQYEFFSQCYRHAAAKRNINPLIMQSATWVYYRKNKIKTTKK